MIKDTISIDEAINFLNELIKLDKNAIKSLLENRVPCNELLANHPSVQVYKCKVDAYHVEPFMVGILGIINGFFGTNNDGGGVLMAVYDDDWNLLRFAKASLVSHNQGSEGE